MKKSKIDRLRSAGWKVGDAQEFLDLSDEEMALIELKLGIADFLREAREQKELTQAALAKRIGSSQSRIAKMEAGDASVSLDLMFRAAFSLGISRRELGKRITAMKTPRRSTKKAG
jgi:ribosome-binding protein aMBF1 (putative translation factor)